MTSKDDQSTHMPVVLCVAGILVAVVSGSWWKSEKASRSGELSHNSDPLAGGYRRMTLWRGIAGVDRRGKARWRS